MIVHLRMWLRAISKQNISKMIRNMKLELKKYISSIDWKWSSVWREIPLDLKYIMQIPQKWPGMSMLIRGLFYLLNSYQIKISLLLVQMIWQSISGIQAVSISNKYCLSQKYNCVCDMPNGHLLIQDFSIQVAVIRSFTFMILNISRKREHYLDGILSLKKTPNNMVIHLLLVTYSLLIHRIH